MLKTFMIRSALLVVACALSVSAHAYASDPKRLDVPAGDLTAALESLASQSGIELVYASEQLKGLSTKGVNGILTPEDAVTKLLEGTPLTFRKDPSGAMLITLSESLLSPQAGEAFPATEGNEAGSPRNGKGEVASQDSKRRLAQNDQSPPAGTSNSREQPDSIADTRSNSGARNNGGNDWEIVVTARKREERLLDVPMAVSAFTGDMIERQGASNIADFLQEAPGVNLFERTSGYKVSIRGISSSTGANENGYYLDELPFTGVTTPIYPDVRSWDMERVEVLRGPQGTLFGEGSMGGTVRILTHDPQFNEWEARAVATGSSTEDGGDNWSGKALLNVPLVDDRLALRFAGTKEEYEGWIDSSVAENLNDQDITTYRGKLRFQPSDRLWFTASYWHFDGEFPRGSSSTDAGTAAPNGLSTTSEYDLYGASLNYEIGPTALFYSYAQNDYDASEIGTLLGGTVESLINVVVRSHELRLSSIDEGPAQWTVGAYHRDADRKDSFEFALFGVSNRDETEATSKAIFGEVTYSFASVPIDVTAGLRYVREELGGFEANTGTVTEDADATFESTNPRLIIAWRAKEEWRVYVSAAKGYRSGQNQSTLSLALAQLVGVDLPATLQDDSVWSYELGTKASLANGRVVIEGAVYHNDWEDAPALMPLPGTNFAGSINSDGTETTGIEASIAVRLANAWTVNLGGSYADATYAGDVPGTGIQEGNPVDDHARTTASASVDYRPTIFNGLQGLMLVAAQYNSAREFPSIGPPQFLPGDAMTTLTARVGAEGDHWGMYVVGENLTNEDGAASPRQVSNPALPGTAYRLRPRTVGVEFLFSFGGP
jgi:outer membrane receptor protein involved in Fe transport